MAGPSDIEDPEGAPSLPSGSLAAAATHRYRPRGGWRLVAVAATILFLLTSSALFFANVDRVVPGWFYSRGSILP